MTGVYIVETASVTALGDGITALYQGLVQGKTGIVDMSGAHINTSPYLSSWAGLVPGLARTPGTPRIFTLADRLLKGLGPIDPDTCLITASTKAGIDLLPGVKKGDRPLPDGLLVSSLPGYISQRLGLRRPGFNISAACASSTIALAKGAAMIQSGLEQAVLVCAMDVVSEFVFSGFSALGAMSPLPAAPFDRNRKGLTLGEGAAGVLLMGEKNLRSARTAENRTALARISGWGVANDACHLTAPARDGAGLKMAVLSACRKAGIRCRDIRAVNAHGTGTLHNDAMEIAVLKDLFDPATMANSIKGAIGHTLGAAGAIETALCVKLLETCLLPGTTGFSEPEPIAPNYISSHARPFAKGPILTMNSGFGGINAVLILQAAAT